MTLISEEGVGEELPHSVYFLSQFSTAIQTIVYYSDFQLLHSELIALVSLQTKHLDFKVTHPVIDFILVSNKQFFNSTSLFSNSQGSCVHGGQGSRLMLNLSIFDTKYNWHNGQQMRGVIKTDGPGDRDYS